MLACTCSFNNRSSSQMKIRRPKPSAEDPAERPSQSRSLELGDALGRAAQILQLSPEPVTAGEKQTSLLQTRSSGFLSLTAKLVPKGHSKFSICLSRSRFRPCLLQGPRRRNRLDWRQHRLPCPPASAWAQPTNSTAEFALLNTCKVHQDLFTRTISSVLFKMAKCWKHFKFLLVLQSGD